MSNPDVLGWLAAGLMVATFGCREARAMRPLAVATNLAFIGYGAAASLAPVLALHGLLLPINLWRWAEVRPGKGIAVWSACFRSGPRWALILLLSSLLVACGGGGAPEPEPEPEPLEFVQVGRFVEISGMQADGRHIYAQSNNFIGPERYDEPGEYLATVEMGGLPFILPGYDAIAQGEIYSSETGKTFWVRSEAAKGRLGTTDNIGTRTRLEQGQTFRKKADGATLELVISEVLVELLDQNPQPLSIDDCPWINQPTNNDCSGVMIATVDVGVMVWSPDVRSGSNNLLGRDGYVELRGWRDHWEVDIDHEWNDLWTAANFDVDDDVVGDGSRSHLRVRLKQPIVLSVPLDRVPLEGDIYVNNTMKAVAFNHRQRESYAAAYYRDPVRVGLNPEVFTDGLEQRPWNAAAAPDRADAAPVCTGEPDPLAGTLQFERAGFAAMELPGAGARIKVTRSGGSRGEVSVQFSTADGTAVAGQDYESVNRVVVFREGESGRKTVRVPIALDPEIEAAETVELRLSDVRGCAALGALSTAVLTIGDDDSPPPSSTAYSVGGTVTGLAGSGLVLEDRAQFVSLPIAANGSFAFNRGYFAGAGYDVRVATPPSGPAQVCTVSRGSGTVATANVGDIAVDCVTPPPPSGLDASFGSGGLSTAGPGGAIKAIALQADGRIVAAIGNALARYHADGSLDTSFGTAGTAAGVLGPDGNNEIFDIAVQPDGRIVAAGKARASGASSLGDDFAAARYNADGSRDAGFNAGQPLQVDWIGAPDRATRVLLQPDGRIVLAGFATTTYTSTTDNTGFAVARLNADGTLDAGFGSGGRAAAEIGQLDFGYAAALEPDGKIVVAGRVSYSRGDESDVGVARFNADGTLDTGFGSKGRRTFDLSANWDEATAMLVQPDGKLLLAVAYSDVGNFAFGLLRLTAAGERDPSFGTDGFAWRHIGSGNDSPSALVLQADGRIVVAGHAVNTATSFDVALARFGSDGSPDTGFGNGGAHVFDLFNGPDGAGDLVLQPDGRIVAAGSALNGLATLPLLLRLVP
jgi:uncharacterized delta-60 repeat protein